MLKQNQPEKRQFRHRLVRGFSTLAFVAAIGSSIPAFAQGETDVEDDSDVMIRETVIVTAQKRAQNLQDVPISIQAFSAAQLEEAGIRDFSEIVTLVPGASEEQSWNVGMRFYQMRGVSQGPGDPTVGNYIDDTAFNIAGVRFGPIGRSFDLERVEVLRGPQSTLYGAGSMGGTVRYITKKPDLESFGGEFRAGVSNTDGGDTGYYGDLALSLPIIKDKLAVRLAGGVEEVAGYQDLPAESLEDVNDAELNNLRATVLFQPTDNLSFELMAMSAKANQDGGTFLRTLDPPTGAFLSTDFNNVEYDIYSGTVEYDFGSFIATSTTSQIDYLNALSWNVDFFVFGTPAPGGAFQGQLWEGKAINNETRLVSSGDTPLQWIVGTFYSDSEVTTDTDLEIPAFAIDVLATNRDESEAFSVFGEVSYELLDGKLVPLFGLRYFTDERAQPLAGFSDKFESVNPRFNLTYNSDNGDLYYLNVAKGFRSGNFNDPATVAIHNGLGLPATASVDSDALWSYEVGSKKALFDNQLTLEAALYYQDWQDTRALIPAAGLFLDYQAGDSEIYGIDMSFAFAPTSLEGFSLNGSFNWNSSEYSDILPEISATSGISNGDRLPFVPEWTFATTAAYEWAFGTSGYTGEAVIGYSHIAEQLGQSGTVAVGDPRDLLRARFAVSKGAYSLALFGSNLLNEDGAIYSQVQDVGFNTFTQDHPRQIGLELGVKF